MNKMMTLYNWRLSEWARQKAEQKTLLNAKKPNEKHFTSWKRRVILWFWLHIIFHKQKTSNERFFVHTIVPTWWMWMRMNAILKIWCTYLCQLESKIDFIHAWADGNFSGCTKFTKWLNFALITLFLATQTCLMHLLHSTGCEWIIIGRRWAKRQQTTRHRNPKHLITMH